MSQLDASNAAAVDHDPLLSESSLEYPCSSFLGKSWDVTARKSSCFWGG